MNTTNVCYLCQLIAFSLNSNVICEMYMTFIAKSSGRIFSVVRSSQFRRFYYGSGTRRERRLLMQDGREGADPISDMPGIEHTDAIYSPTIGKGKQVRVSRVATECSAQHLF